MIRTIGTLRRTESADCPYQVMVYGVGIVPSKMEDMTEMSELMCL